jgi:hypothetical protein
MTIGRTLQQSLYLLQSRNFSVDVF